MMFKYLRERLAAARFYSLYLRSPSVIKKWQDASVRNVVRHAGRNVPMWRMILEERGLNIDSIQGVDDLRLLPIINKGSFMGKEYAFYTDNSRNLPTETHMTSGSTGRPFTFLPSDKMLFDKYYNNFGRFRFLTWKKRSLFSLPEIRSARIRVTPEIAESRLFIHVSEFLQDPNSTIAKINAFKPEVIESCPSVLIRLAQVALQDPSHAPRVPYAVTVGEMLARSARKLIENSLHCELYDRYGTEEFGTVGLECDQHNGYHIHPESVVVEVVNAAGKRVREGEEGRIVITSLLNYNMPFIRYDIGDCGTMRTERCACGLRTPRVWIVGRYAGLLHFNGRDFHRMEFETKLKRFGSSIIQYQVVKTGPRTLAVRIVPASGFDPSSMQRIEEEMRGVVGVGVEIQVEKVAHIAQMPSGKSQTIVDESVVT